MFSMDDVRVGSSEGPSDGRKTVDITTGMFSSVADPTGAKRVKQSVLDTARIERDQAGIPDMETQAAVGPRRPFPTELQDAASFAGLLVTTEAMVAEKPRKKESAPAGMPDMGGMGGMDM